MSLPSDEPVCPKFQPNIFDPSRCHDCLRQKHLHNRTGEGVQGAPPLPQQQQQKVQTEPETGTVTWIGSSRGARLTPIQSQAEDRDTSSKDDSDSVSVVSSHCNINGGHVGCEEAPFRILSPGCELYICDDNYSSDSCQFQSEEFSSSVSAEEEYLPVPRRSTSYGMTRLDPPPHRPNPRAWMDDTQGRGGFLGHSGFKQDKEKRESGYFSLGRATGARSLHESSPPAPYRHFERGHPIFSSRNVEPKDVVPFRNPNLGVASERQIPDVFQEDFLVEELPPDPYEVAVEVEAQVGPRSPSPTPFKIAESLALSGRKAFNRGNSPSPISSFQQSGRNGSSRFGSALQSRSSSPSAGNLHFRRSESSNTLARQSHDGGGWSQRAAREPKALSQANPSERRFESGTLPRNFKTSASSVKSQSNTISDFKSSLRKPESGGSLGRHSTNPVSPSLKRNHNSSSQMSLRGAEVSSTFRRGHEANSRSPSPARKADSLWDSRSSSPRKDYSFSSHSTLRKSGSITSLTGRSHYGRCGSPIREGYGMESQTSSNGLSTGNLQNGQDFASASGQSYDRSNKSILRKSESKTSISSRGQENRSSSSGRKAHEALSQSPHRRKDTGGSLRGQNSDSRSSSPRRGGYETPSKSLLSKAEVNSAVRSRESYSSVSLRKGREATDKQMPQRSMNRSSSSGRSQCTQSYSSVKGNSSPPGYSVLKTALSGEPNHSFQRKNAQSEMKSDSRRSPQSWRGWTHSIRSSSLSRAPSPSRHHTNGNRATFEASRSPGSLRSGSGRHRHEDRVPSSSAKKSTGALRSSSPAPRIPENPQHTSSQSSMESSASSQHSLGSTGRNREEYIAMADLPKVKMIHSMEGSGSVGKSHGQQPVRRQELFKPASHSLSKHPYTEWEDTADTEREWQYGGSGYLSRAHSSTSLQRSGSPTADEASSWKGNSYRSDQMQPDLLNFKKGWMSKLDDSGEWKKHWFVLTDAGLKYYRDLTAEEKDDLDGEIDLKSCVKVSEFDVEKNYGFQIQTREAVFTLSAMTAGIRRNWIEVLKKCIRPSSSPDLTQLPDNSSDKENSHARHSLFSGRSFPRHGDAQSEVSTPAADTSHRFDYVELSPVPASSGPPSSGHREAGEGQGRERSRVQEEENTSSQWEAVLSRKGSGKGSNQRLRLEEEIERKWAELERMPLKEVSSLPSHGGARSGSSANEALQREVASLRQQLEQLQQGGDGGGGVRGGCGPEAACSRSLAAMERAHQKSLEELQRQHQRQLNTLEAEKDRLLLEDSQDTARVVEALKKKHKEELEAEVERAKRLSSGLDSQTLRARQQAETQALKRELDGLSERYSQKCLELNRAEQSSAEREREISRKEKDLEQLRKENLDLRARLKEEMTRAQAAITGEDKDRVSCELQVLVRIKDNEIEYLHKEICCLRNELQFLNREKELACERYAEVNVELTGMKGRTEREIQNLKEHLRLALAALQEDQKLGNSLDH